jgi:hypothetical protein
MKYGWRLTRTTADDGTAVLEWRCPKCWLLYREQRGNRDTTRTPGRSDGR